MKKYLIAFAISIIGMAGAQIKIKDNPATSAEVEPSAILELESTNKAFLMSRVANTAAIIKPINGMMVYDMSSDCFKGYQKDAWSECFCGCSAGGSTSTVTNLQCTSAVTSGLLTAYQTASGVTVSVPYTGGTGTYSAISIPSTGVTGLTATAAAGTANGNSNLVLTVSGIPQGSGTASFNLSFGGKNCTVSLNVASSCILSDVLTGGNQGYTLTGGAAFSGIPNGIFLNPTDFSSGGTMYKSFSTVAGRVYKVTIGFAKSGFDGQSTTNILNGSGTAGTILATDVGSGVRTALITFTATSSTSTIWIRDTNGSSYRTDTIIQSVSVCY